MNVRSASALLSLLLAAPCLPAWGAKLSRPKVSIVAQPAPVSMSPLAQTALPLTPSISLAPLPKSVLSGAMIRPQAAVPVPAPAPAAPLQVLDQAAAIAIQAAQGAAPQESALRDIGAVFDQSGRPAEAAAPITAPPLDGIIHQGARLIKAGRPLELLGRGSFGAVYAHPEQPDAVIKLMTASPLLLWWDTTSWSRTAAKDARVAARLADAGVGPRVLAETAIPGKSGIWRRWLARLPGMKSWAAPRPAVVKERIFGDTVQHLLDRRGFGPRDYALVQDMLGRMADARIRVQDLRPANIMIGRTAADPEPRAYMFDGNYLMKVAPDETRDQLLESLKQQRPEILGADEASGQWGDPGHDPLDAALQAGLRLSAAVKK
ncbi:MAG: hypothetical protein WC881_03935 [Elusimicrobiota bacterium]